MTDAWAGRLIAAHMGHDDLPEIDIVPIVKRQDSLERAKSLHREAHKHGASKDVKEAIAEQLRALE
jgi:hypothetical protein